MATSRRFTGIDSDKGNPVMVHNVEARGCLPTGTWRRNYLTMDTFVAGASGERCCVGTICVVLGQGDSGQMVSNSPKGLLAC